MNSQVEKKYELKLSQWNCKVIEILMKARLHFMYGDIFPNPQ